MPNKSSAQLLSVLLLALLPTAQSRAGAPDVITLSNPGSGPGQVRLSGTVLDYTGGEIVIRLADGREMRYPGERVERIDSPRSEPQLAGEQAVAAGDYRQALAHFRLAVDADPRTWMRRKLLAEIVWCYRALGEVGPAGQTFLVLLASDPQTADFDAIPLAWETREPDPQLAATAARWLDDQQSPAAMLMGASQLLTSRDRAAAVQRLQALEQSTDVQIAELAHAQLWRLRVVTATPAEVDRWPESIARLPAGLRAGPYFVLGQALARREDRRTAAALAYLRVPILYPRDRSLAAAALLGAGQATEQGGDAIEARRIYQELIQNYPESLASREGKSRLEQLESTPAG